MDDIEKRFRKVLTEDTRISLPRGEVTLGSSLIDDLGLDSLDTVELVMGVEEEFGIEVPDDVAEKCLTVQDCLNTINAALE